jgi:hypothetical protein
MTCAGCELFRLRGRVQRAVPPGHDEFFGAELWLRSECCGGQLVCARNHEHLEHLREVVATERPEPHAPEWMRDAAHRDEVLQHLDRLRGTLDR